MNSEENILGTEKIGKLMLKFSIPSIISLVVNSLYNIVDQIFIGRGVGYLGNGATNVVFPITVVAMALSFMIADGGAAYMSLKLGEKKKDEASKGVANAITMAVAVSILLFAIGMIFLPQLLNLFGCTDGLREYAMSYGRIIVMGLPFYIIGSALNGMIRADGAPKYAMASMVTGAIINIIFIIQNAVDIPKNSPDIPHKLSIIGINMITGTNIILNSVNLFAKFNFILKTP